MAKWTPVSTKDFDGSTASIERLKGRKVRNRATLHSVLVYEAADPKKAQENHTLAAGTAGLVSYKHPNMRDLLIAIPLDAKTPLTTLDALMRRECKVLVVNGATFRTQFELET